MKREIDNLLEQYEKKFKEQKIKQIEAEKAHMKPFEKAGKQFGNTPQPTGYRINPDSIDLIGPFGCICGECSSEKRPTVSNSSGKVSLLSPRKKISDEFYFNVVEAADDAVDVLLLKHEDYGPTNIANAPGGAVNGLIVRLYDKIARLNNLYINNSKPNYENLYDTFLDIANYGIIGMLVVEDKWNTGE
jgi:hypothetical protein